MVDAFAMQAAQLTQSTSDWSQLRAAAAGGQLRMEPGVAEKAAQRCEAMVATLDDHYAGARVLKVGGAAGDCEIGCQLGQTFDAKALGGSNSLMSALAQHQQILTEMAETYRAAGAAFTVQERLNTDSLGTGG